MYETSTYGWSGAGYASRAAAGEPRERERIVIETDEKESNMQCDRNTNLMSLLGGAGIGAALMYFFDPEEGSQRRHELVDLTGSAWGTVKEKASEYGHATAVAAGAFGNALSDKASEYGSAISDRASNVKHRVANSGFGHEASDRMRYLVRGKQSHGIESGTGQLFTALGCIALGVGAMYLLDPTDGARRRTTLRDKFLSGFGKLGRSIDGVTKDLFNRASGLKHEATSYLSREDVDDRVLVERVRAGLGHCVANINNIVVESHNGRVIVSGPVQASEVDGLLKCVWQTRGVRELVNRLDVQSGPSTVQTGGTVQQQCPPSSMGGLGSVAREGSTSGGMMGTSPAANL
jgi:osmotically-inducible protein OsmY